MSTSSTRMLIEGADPWFTLALFLSVLARGFPLLRCIEQGLQKDPTISGIKTVCVWNLGHTFVLLEIGLESYTFRPAMGRLTVCAKATSDPRSEGLY